MTPDVYKNWRKDTVLHKSSWFGKFIGTLINFIFYENCIRISSWNSWIWAFNIIFLLRQGKVVVKYREVYGVIIRNFIPCWQKSIFVLVSTANLHWSQSSNEWWSTDKADNTHCVKSVRIRSFCCPHFSACRLNPEIYSVNHRIQSKCGKILKNSKYWHFLPNDIFE